MPDVDLQSFKLLAAHKVKHFTGVRSSLFGGEAGIRNPTLHLTHLPSAIYRGRIDLSRVNLHQVGHGAGKILQAALRLVLENR